ncbi:MAG: hypothetical protein COU63_00200 [Candidatus Pacebacteria bacterium CG10_big_fil_rev_8_21_14_0_10_36_11]|nr:HD domain-containing protein [Candidatus Pacearchaeota archaeon]OIP74178.1 MAG: hypothetical protein AUK08_02950 [Candidatus Pacebacteria bacterium CG2_30_36_39]PIR65080.1 MAG: hypothetical protein COU63_00200 [Candidatus Pacebacteria bacterium CG10_big_fil_rev_8_21_14_0_10_36_11]PJC42420.1 MAG: hypothetical protein CO040_04630 [Candidatus Pacebacteria bacterium CG_4_9_14_0_2_um_filter_36_8]
MQEDLSHELNTQFWNIPEKTSLKDKELEAKAEQLIAEAYFLMNEKYGTKGKEPRIYHNPEHINTVMAVAEKIAQKMGLPKEDTILLRIAVAWHDIDSNQESGIDEIKTATTVMKRMAELNFPPIQIRKVIETILATQWYMDTNGAIAQKINNLLGKRKNTIVPTLGGGEEVTTWDANLNTKDSIGILKLKKIMADADLCGMGSEWNTYLNGAIKICRELGILPSHEEPYTDEEWIKFYKSQETILTGFLKRESARTKENQPTTYGYYTAAAQEILPHVAENLVKTQQILGELQAKQQTA